ncbi:ABC transporter substrate-binding protein [Microbacterium sp. MAHUQ-60]|uniref:ABC transporter substrate-binding protein n=1 Tax=unclassified Microbacterium TaxID=2609290 RepID=UPI003623ACB8
MNIDRRTFLALSGMAGLGLGLAACGVSQPGTAAPGGADGVSLRYGWWGNTIRQRAYEKAFETFVADHPNVTVQPEFAEYAAFQERMTTQIAGKTVPDIFWIASAQVLSYYKAGIYHDDLDKIDTLDLSNFTPEQLALFKIDGKLNTVPLAVTAPVVRFNETFLAEAGATLPEEGSAGWSWDGLAEFLIDYTKDAPKGRVGIAHNAQQDLTFESWLRQHGQQLWDEDGNVGFDADGLGGWLDWWEKLRKAGATLSLSEQEGPGMDWALAGDKTLMTFGNANHIADHAKMFPDYSFELRGMPLLPDAAAGHTFGFMNRLTIYSGIDPQRLADAGRFLSFNLNHEAMLTPTLSLGAPVSGRQLEAAFDVASPDEQKMLRIVQHNNAQESKPRYEAPAGTGTWRNIMTRTIEEIVLGGMPVTQASQRMIDEVQREIDQVS